jgi:hypothetical protein
MSSYTSSFRQELKVIIFVLTVLLGVEIAIRRLAPSFSREVRYLRDIPERVKKMARSEKFRIVVLGNSLTNCGFNSKDFKAEMDSLGARPLHIEVIAMDAAAICEWSWLLQNFFWDHNLIPDLIIVNGATWQDRKDLPLDRLSLYLDTEDIIPFFTEDITEFGQRMEFLHAFALNSYANRKRVRLKVLSSIIAHYQTGTTEVHRVAQIPATTTDKTKIQKLTYRQATRLANGALKRNIPVVFVTMPLERTYDLQTGFPEAIRSAGAEIADCRNASAILQGLFLDGSHMNEKGAHIFSRELARKLWDQFPHLFKRPATTSRPVERLIPNEEHQSGLTIGYQLKYVDSPGRWRGDRKEHLSW